MLRKLHGDLPRCDEERNWWPTVVYFAVNWTQACVYCNKMHFLWVAHRPFGLASFITGILKVRSSKIAQNCNRSPKRTGAGVFASVLTEGAGASFCRSLQNMSPNAGVNSFYVNLHHSDELSEREEGPLIVVMQLPVVFSLRHAILMNIDFPPLFTGATRNRDQNMWRKKTQWHLQYFLLIPLARSMVALNHRILEQLRDLSLSDIVGNVL